jgi:hypothetical protein
VGEHEVTFVTDDLRQADVTVIVALEMIDQIGSVSRILLAPLFLQPVPATPVECEDAVKNPPPLERFGNVWVAHNLRF